MGNVLDSAKSDSKEMTIFGGIAIVLGMICMLAPGLTGLSIVTLVGVFVLVGGIVRMIWAFKAGTFGRGVLTFAVGGLTLLAGIVLLANPVFASGVLTIMLLVYFFADGIVEIAAGMQARGESGSGWLIFGGVVSILLGIMMWRQFPLAGMWAIGILFGIKLFFSGLIMVTGGSALRKVVKRVEKP